jgi:hypothetical protein
MQQRSDFQAAMLYYSAASYAASILLGGGGFDSELAARIYETIRNMGAEGLGVAQGLPRIEQLPSFEELKAEGIGPELLSRVQSFGWFAAAGGAALWSRLQTVALAALAALSGQQLYGILPIEGGLGSKELSSYILEAASFATASLGLGGKALPGRGMKRVVRSAL